MRAPSYLRASVSRRQRGAALAGLAVGLSLVARTPPAAAADALAVQASLTCAPASEAGRVRCEVEATVPGAQIKWADAEILKVPDLITPLKGRIGPRDAAVKEGQLWRLSLALVARRPGTGAVVVRVRVVACKAPSAEHAKETCVPLTVEATGQVKVGG